MANFDISLKLTGGNEGGYANSTNDRGGETFAGIARKFGPSWSGWEMIDSYKAIHGLTNINSLLKNPEMIAYINHFYKLNFWGVNKLDLINDQQIANNIYDMGVNSGVGTAAKMLQMAAKVTVDGIIGSGTIADVNSGNAVTIYNSINNQREAFYTQIAKNPGQAQFLKSWLSRIRPYK